MRVTPLDHDGEPIPCVTDQDERPCDIEVTAEREVFYRSHSPAVAGMIGPALSLRRGSEPAVFALEPTGFLVGLGLFQQPDAAQVLFCRLTEEPALRCHHEIGASVRDRVWNEENCSESFVARVDGGTIAVTFFGQSDAPPSVAARIEPPPADNTAKALALFLYAMEVVDRDVEHHAPYVVDMQVPH
jgi:hypothetical protein